jgi:hypothetical protein
VRETAELERVVGRRQLGGKQTADEIGMLWKGVMRCDRSGEVKGLMRGCEVGKNEGLGCMVIPTYTVSVYLKASIGSVSGSESED